MISCINGSVINIEGQAIDILTSSGVGYQIYVNDVFKKNDDILLYLVSSFDSNGVYLKTYGYITPESRKVHNLLTEIQGLGSSYAFNLLSMGAENLIIALESKDEVSLKKIKGIGAKMISKLFSFYEEKRNHFPIMVNRAIISDEYKPTQHEIRTLSGIIGIADTNLLIWGLTQAKEAGIDGPLKYREAAKLIISQSGV